MEAPTTAPALDLRRCFDDALEVYRRNFLTFVLAVILFDVLMLCSLFVLTGPLVGGMVLLCLRATRDPEHKAHLGDLFGTFDRFGAWVGFFALTTIPVLLGTALLIVPGVLLATVWLFAPFLMVDRNMGVIDSLRTSWRVVQARGFWINAACAALVFALSLGPLLFPYVGTLVAWLVAPVAWLINTSAYVQEVKEHADLAEFAPRGFPVVPLANTVPPTTA